MGRAKLRLIGSAAAAGVALTSCGTTAVGVVSPSVAVLPDPTVDSSYNSLSIPAGPQTLAGTWTTSDGNTITFGDDGLCEGAFYVNGRPFDIDGPMACQLSNTPDQTGRYPLVVVQGPNRGAYLVEFDGDVSAAVYTRSGQRIYTMTRF
ncbi:MAG: hypothetical protein ACSLE6_18750 [Mycobacterium sp.]